MRNQLNVKTTSETIRTHKTMSLLFTYTLKQCKGLYDEDDNDGQMVSVNRLGLKFPDFCLDE